MFKLLVLTALLAVGFASGASDIDAFAGEWLSTELWPAHAHIDIVCNPFKIESLNMATKCGDKDVSLIRFSFDGEGVEFPAIVVETQAEVADAVKTKCEEYEHHYVFRRFNENYFALYMPAPEPINYATVLFAKNAPTKTELAEFVSKYLDMKEQPGTPICTKEQFSNPDTKKRTSAKLGSLFSKKKQ